MPATSALPSHLRAAAVAALSAPFRCSGEAAGLPQRIKILNWGENPVRPGGEKVILVDDVVAETLAANQELVGIDRVPMDYEHQSHPGHKNYKPDPRHSPGSGRIEVVRGDGVYLSAIDYSPNGVEHAASYLDASAVVHHDKDGRPLWISCVALTQTGAVAGIEFIEAIAASLNLTSNNTMDNTDEKTFRELIIKLLKMTPSADSGEITDEEIVAAVNSATDKMADEPTKPGGTEGEPQGTEALSARIVRLEEFESRREREALLDRAKAEGKVVPLSNEQAMQTPVAVLSAIISNLTPGEVPTGTDKGSQEKPGEKTTALSADESAAAKALGLTPEEYAAAKA